MAAERGEEEVRALAHVHVQGWSESVAIVVLSALIAFQTWIDRRGK